MTLGLHSGSKSTAGMKSERKSGKREGKEGRARAIQVPFGGRYTPHGVIADLPGIYKN